MEIEIGGLRFIADVSAGRRDAGPLVVLLHGFPHSRHTWRAEVARLDSLGYRVVAFDQRGYSAGARPSGIEPYRVEHLVQDVIDVADAIGDSRPGADDPGFHLVGHDWGGQLAWVTAGLHPDRVRSLAVISRPHPVAFVAASRADQAQAERSKHHRSFQRPEATAELLVDDAAKLRASFARIGVAVADAAVYLETVGTHDALDAAINWYRAVEGGSPMAADVPTIEVPTLYVWGDEDSSVGRAAAEATAEHVTGRYRFVEVPGGSHTITDQFPGLFTDLLVEHLEANLSR